MIFGRNQQSTPVQSQMFSLKGGLNEQVTNAELKPGELIGCLNYIEQDDVYSGYQSIGGYERYDGQAAPSDTALDSPVVGAEVDTTREAARSAITEVPDNTHGDGVQGIHVYNDKVYAFRNYDATNCKMYVDSAAGWVEVDTSGAPLLDLAATNKVRAINYRFSTYDTNDENMFWVDGVNNPRVFDGTTVSEITHANLPTSPTPTHIGAWQNRLFLVYPGGHIFFSEVGDPTAWDSSTGLAGEIYIGDDVTGVKEAPGGVLVFFTKSSIKVLHYGSTSNDFIFKLEEYSDSTGALQDTAINLSGTLFFADDKGFTSFTASADTGGFTADIIGKNVYKTFQTSRGEIQDSVADRDTSRYYLFYNTGTTTSGALVYTFINRRLKGVSKIQLNHKVFCSTDAKFTDGTSKMFFGSTDGYVYQMNKGTSFDGDVIMTSLTTSYHHYRSPRSWKNFKRLYFEITAETGTTISIGTRYDYSSPLLVLPDSENVTSTGSGGVWGTSIWGSFTWSANLIQSPPVYIQGHGRNMSVLVQTESKYRTQHTIHNIATDFAVGSMQQ